jgi:hypothetical protein
VHAASAVVFAEFGDVESLELLGLFGLFEFGDPFGEAPSGELGPRPAP